MFPTAFANHQPRVSLLLGFILPRVTRCRHGSVIWSPRILIVADVFIALGSHQSRKRAYVDVLGDKPHRAITQGCIHPGRMEGVGLSVIGATNRFLARRSL